MYAIDVRDVLFCVRQGLLPVTPAGYVSEVDAIRSNRRIRWDVMLLDFDREVALKRCALRGDTDLADGAWPWRPAVTQRYRQRVRRGRLKSPTQDALTFVDAWKSDGQWLGAMSAVRVCAT